VNDPRFALAALMTFATEVLVAAGVRPEDAALTADGLLAADLRGIESHGLAHLPRRLERLATGQIVAQPIETVVHETPISAVIDAGGGLGIPPTARAMGRALAKAAATGVGIVVIRNSSHNGIASYYALKALAYDCIGLAMTNATPMVAPPGARRAVYGTNPFAVAVPAAEEPPLVLDMATSAAAWGKVETAARRGEPIPLGIALDAEGQVTTDAARALAARVLLPLGGLPETGAYKGFGLAVLVDLLTAALSGGGVGQAIRTRGSSHLVAALRIDFFRPPEAFKRDVDHLIRELRATPVAEGAPPVSLPGEREYRLEAARRQEGVPLAPATVAELHAVAQRYGVPFPAPL
jgi:LDH2 family malate/lactate/ureidoglycolate dehydrogenase